MKYLSALITCFFLFFSLSAYALSAPINQETALKTEQDKCNFHCDSTQEYRSTKCEKYINTPEKKQYCLAKIGKYYYRCLYECESTENGCLLGETKEDCNCRENPKYCGNNYKDCLPGETKEDCRCRKNPNYCEDDDDVCADTSLSIRCIQAFQLEEDYFDDLLENDDVKGDDLFNTKLMTPIKRNPTALANILTRKSLL